jgi:peptidoglycan-N-acetylglucosamine deacetylase
MLVGTTIAQPTTTTEEPTTTVAEPETLPPTTTPKPTPAPTTPLVLAAGAAPRQVSKGDAPARSVAFSFDAGSDTGSANQILDLLAAEGIRASFGITGTWATSNATIARRIATDGHQLINHTQHHPSFTGFSTKKNAMTADQIAAELDEAEASIIAAAGVGTKPWMRPPFGDIDKASASAVAAAGFPMIAMWTVDSGGWQGLEPAKVTQRCLDKAVPGAIYVFHVGSASTDFAALPAIIKGLRDNGYAIVSIPEVLAP